ncbi:hypothetical protein Tco_0685932 [Tanacetum coccineum]
MKVKESLNVTFDESPPSTKLSPLVDDDVGEEEAIENNTKVVNNSNKEDESIEVDEVVNIKESKNHPFEQVIEECGIEENRSSNTKMLTPFANPERQFQSRKGITPIAVHNIYSFFESELSELESEDLNRIDIETLTLEQYLALNRAAKRWLGRTSSDLLKTWDELWYGYLRKGRKTKPKRLNQTRNGKAGKRQSPVKQEA